MVIERRTPPKPGRTPKKAKRRRQYWFEKVMAAIALVNYGLVLFDMSYIRFRDLYLQYIPTVNLPGTVIEGEPIEGEPTADQSDDTESGFNLTVWYGETFKGIEPNRATEAYLRKVDDLVLALEQDGLPKTDLSQAEAAVVERESTLPDAVGSTDFPENFSGSAPENLDSEFDNTAEFTEEATIDDRPTTGTDDAAIAAGGAEVLILLAELRSLSAEIIDENPFAIADKSGTLERIKERMRDHVDVESSTQAFEIFWSQPYLQERGWVQELEFFRDEIRPLFETNYYRSIGLDGNPTDLFILLDSWFTLIFTIELVLRSIYISRRYQGTNFFDAILWRWYDLFLIIPFWRWLRIIPVVNRINQSNLIDLSPISNRIRRVFVTYFAIELTEIVIIRIIEQAQNLIKDGDFLRQILDENQAQRYVDLNGVDEVQVITQKVTSVLVYQVLPELRPDLEAILTHSVLSALQASPLYSGLVQLPGMKNMPQQVTQQVCGNILNNLYGVLTQTIEDEKGAELAKKLTENLTTTFRREMQVGDTLPEIQSLLNVLLDEVKINYVQNLAEEDLETLREETQQIYQLTQKTY